MVLLGVFAVIVALGKDFQSCSQGLIGRENFVNGELLLFNQKETFDGNLEDALFDFISLRMMMPLLKTHLFRRFGLFFHNVLYGCNQIHYFFRSFHFNGLFSQRTHQSLSNHVLLSLLGKLLGSAVCVNKGPSHEDSV